MGQLSPALCLVTCFLDPKTGYLDMFPEYIDSFPALLLMELLISYPRLVQWSGGKISVLPSKEVKEMGQYAQETCQEVQETCLGIQETCQEVQETCVWVKVTCNLT